MRVLIAEPDLRLRSELYTALNDAGFWLFGVPTDRASLSLPRVRRPPSVLITDLAGGACGSGTRIAATLRDRWNRLGVIYTAANGAEAPPLGERDRLLRKPFAPDELIRCVRELAA